jgi:hypothetical protein
MLIACIQVRYFEAHNEAKKFETNNYLNHNLKEQEIRVNTNLIDAQGATQS